MDNTRQEPSALTKMLLEMGPLIIFFIVNLKADLVTGILPFLEPLGKPIFVATACFMVAMAISLSVSYWLSRTLPVMPVVSAVVLFIFGTLTLILQDDLFIKIKPTLVNTLFGLSLLIALRFNKPLLKYVFDGPFSLTDEGWKLLSLRWGLFFLFLAILNEVVWRFFSTDFWVTFKVWGVFPITCIFAVCQLPVLKTHGLDKDGDE